MSTWRGSWPQIEAGETSFGDTTAFLECHSTMLMRGIEGGLTRSWFWRVRRDGLTQPHSLSLTSHHHHARADCGYQTVMAMDRPPLTANKLAITYKCSLLFCCRQRLWLLSGMESHSVIPSRSDDSRNRNGVDKVIKPIETVLDSSWRFLIVYKPSIPVCVWLLWSGPISRYQNNGKNPLIIVHYRVSHFKIWISRKINSGIIDNCFLFGIQLSVPNRCIDERKMRRISEWCIEL